MENGPTLVHAAADPIQFFSHNLCLHDPEFCRGVYSTNFVEELLGGGRRELIQEKA